MSETQYALAGFQSGTIGADGTFTISGVGPSRAGERWEVLRWNMTVTTACTFKIFRGTTPNDRYQIDVSLNKDTNVSETNVKLANNERVTFQWTGGTAGDACTISWDGFYYVPGRRAY